MRRIIAILMLLCFINPIRAIAESETSPNYASEAKVYLQSNGGVPLPDSAGNIAEYAIDGDDTTGACAAMEWAWTLHLDLGVIREGINQVVLTFASDTAKPEDFCILTSEDGETWRTVVEVTGNQIYARKAYDFESVNARYIRVRDMKAFVGVSQMMINEIEVYANKTDTVSAYLTNVAEDGYIEKDTQPIIRLNSTMPQEYYSKIKLTHDQDQILCSISANETGKDITVNPKEPLVVGETYILSIDCIKEWKLTVVDRSPMKNVTASILNMNELDFSNYVAENYRAENAIDGNLDTYTFLDFATSGDLIFICELDFHKICVDVSKVIVNFGTSVPPSFNITVSVDGENWQTVYSKYTYGAQKHIIDFAPVEARYLRVVPNERHINIAEIEVMCLPGQDPVEEPQEETGSGPLEILSVSDSEYMENRDYAIYPAFVDNMPYQSWTEAGSLDYYQIKVSGGQKPYQFSITEGRLPEGLFLSNDGKIYGTATVEETVSFTVNVTDANAASVSKELSMTANPYRAYWFEEARFGAMIQWGAFSKPATMNIPEFEERISEGWDADKWAQQIYDMGGRVLNFTLVAGDGVRLWPSKVRPVTDLYTQRDMAQELVDAFHKRGMKLISYISGDYTWIAENMIIDEKTGSMSDLTDGWLRELIERGVDGFWFDSGSFIGQSNLRKQVAIIRTLNPFATIENNPGPHTEGWMPLYPDVDMITTECTNLDPTVNALPVAVRPGVRKKVTADTNALLGPDWTDIDGRTDDRCTTDLKPVEAIIQNIQDNWDQDATYLLCWPVASNGDLLGHPKVAQYLQEIGEWVNQNREPTQTPEASLPDDVSYQGMQTVALTSEPGAKIYYTLDGSNPSDNSLEYTEPIVLEESTKLSACAYIDGKGKSRILRKEYIIIRENESFQSLFSEEQITTALSQEIAAKELTPVASSSRFVEGTDSVSFLCDGNLENCWYPEWGNDKSEAWATVELNAKYQLSSVKVISQEEYTASVWLQMDNEWQQVAESMQFGIGETIVDLQGRQATAIKLIKENNEGIFAINEIIPYGVEVKQLGDRSQMVGMLLTTGKYPIKIESVGRMVSGNDGGKHRFFLIEVSNGSQPLVVADIDMLSGEPDSMGFVYERVAPAILQPFSQYFVLCEEDKNSSYLDVPISGISNQYLKVTDGAMSDFSLTKYYDCSYLGDKSQLLNLKFTPLTPLENKNNNLAYGVSAKLLDNEDRVRRASMGTGHAFYAVDGKEETSAGPSEAWAWTLFIDLEQVYDSIDKVEVSFSPGLYPTEYEIYASVDNVEWVRITHVADKHTDEKIVHTYEPFSARYFKIRSLKPDGPGQEGAQMWISEVGIYN
ncbi:discoidin domain-containing protein [Ructibacterium gallinarum]|uniref:alpha-L-fucosidase n=1 Tax=Ructibacterium gallinarum TaxID=2779355 RepID=A0A9D5RBJ0_9FIRM|nr:discoidin domain-containing protein [Ructibacterium gallinarum]MBE5040078.1 discoidin domain-containing protein [Ructibacterium gallinarum]